MNSLELKSEMGIFGFETQKMGHDKMWRAPNVFFEFFTPQTIGLRRA
jgi:hypothetical protein